MFFNAQHRRVAFLCVLLLGISGITALARVDNNWPHRRPNITVAQTHRVPAGYRPAGVVGYQQPSNNQTQNNQQWQQHNNRTQYIQPGNRPAVHSPAQTNVYKPQPPIYGQEGFNQTRPTWQQPQATNRPQYPTPAWQQGSLNQTRPVWPQPQAPNSPGYPAYGQSSFNQTRPSATYYPQYPQGTSSNQTRPLWPQPGVPQGPNYPQYTPKVSPSSLNQTRPSWSQPSASQLPDNPTQPNGLNSWSSSANKNNLYPQLPTLNLPQAPASPGNSAIPLAPMQPGPPSPQGPHNWNSGGQAVLSYGPGYYPQPAGNTNKNSPPHQGSSNPYANIFN